MNKINQMLTVGAVVFGLGMSALPVLADDDIGENCVPVSVKMAVDADGSCAVRDYSVGDVDFQKEFYPWTNIDGSLFNCEVFGPMMTITDDLRMPTSLAGDIVEGTLGEEEVVGTVACAGHENTFKQPLMNLDPPIIRTQNVSVATLDIPRGRNDVVTVHVAFTGAGLLHLEDLTIWPPHIGASTAGSVVGLVIETKNKIFTRNKADGHLQVQGHIFEPDDPMPGMLTGHICDAKLAKLVDWDAEDDEDDEEED